MNSYLAGVLCSWLFVSVILAIVYCSDIYKRFKTHQTKTKNLHPRAGVIYCTSATKPDSAMKGEGAYEIDTNRFFVFDGMNWIPAKFNLKGR